MALYKCCIIIIIIIMRKITDTFLTYYINNHLASDIIVGSLNKRLRW